MRRLSAPALEEALDFPSLINALQTAFRQEDITTPLRHHHDFPGIGPDNTLLLMPAWQQGAYLGVKIVTVCPDNQRLHLPTIQGAYLLFRTDTGLPLLLLDAKPLTNWRTAAASALASRFLSRPAGSRLLMVGTGALAPFLIRAHAAVRPLTEVFVWGRNSAKAHALAALFEKGPLRVTPLTDLAAGVARADIISCATLSTEPLIRGEWLQPGQHLDLVGSFRPDMREADDECVRRAAVFVDTLEGATRESGDILTPLQRGVLKKSAIRGDLFSLSRREATGRRDDREITFFKSVGHALEDLAAAQLVYERTQAGFL